MQWAADPGGGGQLLGLADMAGSLQRSLLAVGTQAGARVQGAA